MLLTCDAYDDNVHQHTTDATVTLTYDGQEFNIATAPLTYVASKDCRALIQVPGDLDFLHILI